MLEIDGFPSSLPKFGNHTSKDADTHFPKIDPEHYTYKGPFERGSELESLNAYFSVPLQDRPLIMLGLRMAARFAPEPNSWPAPFSEEEFKKQHESLVLDVFANRACRLFAKQHLEKRAKVQPKQNPMVVDHYARLKANQYAGTFALMIDGLSREQIKDALTVMQNYKNKPKRKRRSLRG